MSSIVEFCLWKRHGRCDKIAVATRYNLNKFDSVCVYCGRVISESDMVMKLKPTADYKRSNRIEFIGSVVNTEDISYIVI